MAANVEDGRLQRRQNDVTAAIQNHPQYQQFVDAGREGHQSFSRS